MTRLAFVVAAVVALLAHTAAQPSSPRTWEWKTYGADLASTRYAPLDQINKDNFNTLEVAWRFKTDNLGPRPEFNFQPTPLMVGGVVYTTAGSRRHVVALDAATGELLWNHREEEGQRGVEAPRQLSGRGLAYWSDGRSARIIYVTPGYQMIALDAKTGERISSFGRNGAVDLKQQMDQEMDPVTGDVGLHAAPVIARDVVIIGAAHTEGSRPVSRRNDKGYVRGYDVRTGKRLWIFHTIPRPGEFGHDTWQDGSEEHTGNLGVWAQVSVDEQLGIVYLPTEMPTGDYYGGHRPGDNLFGSGLVAVDLKTGKRKWHYQFIHHDIWDWDVPCAPILADVTIDGKMRQIVAQPTKQGWVYVFDRVTGQPIWPIEERPVAKGDVPGEWYSPTQPFVTKPPAFDRQGVTLDDLIDFTPELRAEAVKLASRYKLGPIFTPPVVSTWEGPVGLLMVPEPTGGANWQGGSFDPETGIMYIFSNTAPRAIGLVPGGEASDMNYIRGEAANPQNPKAPAVGITVQGLPMLKPPYGRITAIDLNKGDLVWQIAHGETPDNIRNHPALKGLTIPRTGRPGRIGTLVTKTLVIAGEGGFATGSDGRRGAMLRAYDKRTGAEHGAVYMPAPQTGSPMTYVLNGRQYIVVAISGPGFPGELMAFRLPEAPRVAAAAQEPTFPTPSVGASATTLVQMFSDYWEWRLAESPELATQVGRDDYNDRWRDWSKAARDRSREHRRDLLQQLLYVNSAGNLTESMRLSANLLEWELRAALDYEPYSTLVGRVSQQSGLHTNIFSTINAMPARTVKDYENIIARLRAVPRYVEQNLELLREQAAAGLTQPEIVVDRVIDQVEAQMRPPALESPLLEAFAKFPASMPAAEQQRLRTQAVAAYEQQFVPAWRQLESFLRGTYRPRARTQIALSSLPNGRRLYDQAVRFHTTTSMTAEQIHALGLKEVARIEREMEAIARADGFTGPVTEYEQQLSKRPGMRFTSQAEMLDYARDILKRLEPVLPKLFRRLPKMQVMVRPIPADREASTASNYEVGTRDGTRPAWFNMNTYRPQEQLKYDVEALVIHETVPGHHLQTALAREVDGLPDFRRAFTTTAYGEGWALYAESLGSELGVVYREPATRFGQLASERFRAVRLVVDTGMHAMGWSRDRAREYFSTHAPSESIAEVDRYIAWPGQALAYKVGQLKIRELRTRAEKELGSKFDVREFHDVVLRDGRLPLEMLEQQVARYIQTTR